MIGVILCGGQSSRMGTDKGLIKLHANTWAQTALDKISSLHLEVFISVNANQYNDYQEVFSSAKLIKDKDGLDVSGPLGGLLSVHLQHPEEDLFILACDMPLMENSILQQLFSTYQDQGGVDAVFFTNDGAPEPLCAIYSARGLAHIMQLLKSQQLTRHSMKFMLEHLPTASIPIREEQKKYFSNFNAHAELNGL